MRGVFDAQAKHLGPRVAAVRERLFEVRIDPAGIDPLIHDVEAIRDDVEHLSTQLEGPYSRASVFIPAQRAEAEPVRSIAAAEQIRPRSDRVALPGHTASEWLPAHLRPRSRDSDRG